MEVRKVAILSPGEMGHSVGRCLLDGGFDVATCLTGRSARTRSLSEAAGIRDVPDLDDLVRGADLVLAILVPDQAAPLAREVAASMERTGAAPAYADCNAVSPATAREIGEIVSGAGGRFIDAGIIGGPPAQRKRPAFIRPVLTRPYSRNSTVTGSSSARWAVRWAGRPASRCAMPR